MWPTADVKGLARAFDQLVSQQLTFGSCVISINDADAVANCEGQATYVPCIGNRSPRLGAREWRFGLRRVDNRWLIESVAAK